MNSPHAAQDRICHTQEHYLPWLHRLAVALVFVTFLLISLGGTVTSKGVGLAVPDWPQSFGYNMFMLPPSRWSGGIFWEHTHRLLGSAVGLLAIIMAFGLWWTQANRRWLSWLGIVTLVAVIVQGVMGGLRVTELSTTWAILHGVTGQFVLCLMVLIAAATSCWWARRTILQCNHTTHPTAVRRLSISLFVVLGVQLVLGATVRHTGSSLAIPDFPASYGGLIPPLTQEGIAAAHDAIVPYDRFHTDGYPTPAQVLGHFAHRTMALVVLAIAIWTIVRLRIQILTDPVLLRPVLAMAVLLVVQVALGAAVIFSGRHPETATAHQTIGAAVLATATLLVIRLHVQPLPRTWEHCKSVTPAMCQPKRGTM